MGRVAFFFCCCLFIIFKKKQKKKTSATLRALLGLSVRHFAPPVWLLFLGSGRPKAVTQATFVSGRLFSLHIISSLNFFFSIFVRERERVFFSLSLHSPPFAPPHPPRLASTTAQLALQSAALQHPPLPPPLSLSVNENVLTRKKDLLAMAQFIREAEVWRVVGGC